MKYPPATLIWDCPSNQATVFHVAMDLPLLAAAALALAAATGARLRGALARGAARGTLLWIGAIPPLYLLLRLAGALDLALVLAAPLVFDYAVACAGSLLAFHVVDWLREDRDPDANRRVRWLAGVTLAGCLGAELAAAHALALLGVGELPALEAAPFTWVHVGRAGTFVPRVAHPGEPRRGSPSRLAGDDFVQARGWNVEPVVVHGDKVGEIPVTYLARPLSTPWISASLPGRVRVAEEVGDARLPLRVGNVWTYGVRATDDAGGLIGLLSGKHTRDRPDLELRVVSARDLPGGGARSFQLQLQGSTRELSVFAADGELLALDEDLKPTPLLEGSPFRFAPIGGACRCIEAGALRGPSHCMEDHRSSAAAQLGVGVLTLGLFAPGATHIDWTLKATRRGPADAASVEEERPADACVSLEMDPEPVDEAPPTTRSTLAEHAAATPSWAAGASAALAWTLFTDAREKRPVADAWLLACEAVYSGNPNGWFIFSGDTVLDLSLRIGALEPVAYHAAGDSHRASLFIGPVALSGGEKLVVDFAERTKGKLARVTATVPKTLPLHASRGLAAIECRAASPTALEAELLRLLADADQELTVAAEGAHGDASSRARTLGPARERLRAAAQLVGWSDPRVRRRVARDARIEAHLSSGP